MGISLLLEQQVGSNAKHGLCQAAAAPPPGAKHMARKRA